MSVTTGRRLGPYEIGAALGSGGMGVVYKAHDPRLDRPVAIKALRPAGVTPDRRERFVQEAKAASALNHPHIVHIYDIVRAEDDDCIVMEYVEGETLDRLMRRGRLPMRDALRYAVQIADALAAAHAAGIVHRDVKPSNIIITADSPTRETVAKLLDFGVAKLTEAWRADTLATTRTGRPETADGTLLGTVSYMSPEQAEGRSIDARSDVFSFGALLYEMVTGRAAFARDSTLATLSAILHHDPVPVAQVTDGVPDESSTLIARCLRKDPRRRVQVMDDVKIVLEEILERGLSPGTPGALPPRADARGRHAAAVGAVMVAAVALGYAAVRPVPLDTGAFRYTPLATEPDFEGYPTWSPDGRSIAYLADVNGERHILVRSLDGAVPAQITTTPHDPSYPFWSSDGARIYYSRGATIWSVSVAGGEPRLELEDARIATMSPDGGTLAFLRGPGGNSSLWFTPTGDLAPQHYRTPPFPETFTFSLGLDFSPDGGKVAVMVAPRDQTASETELWIVPVPSGEPRRVPVRVPYGRDEARVSWTADNRHVVLAGAASGGRARRHLYLADTERGSIQSLTSGVMEEVSPSVSPDGSRIAFASGTDDADLVQMAVDGSVVRTLLASALDERQPSWSPDGNQIAYVTNARGSVEIWLRSLQDGWSTPVVTAETAGAGEWQRVGKPALSPDGQRIVYEVIGATHGIWVSPASGGRAVLLDTESPDQHSPAWSPDGQWIAYQRLRDGRWELVKLPLGGGAPVALAEADPGGGLHTAWSPTGEWIAQTYRGRLRVVAVDGETTTDLGPGSPAFGFSNDGSLLHAVRRSPDRDWELSTFVVATGVERDAVALNIPRGATVTGFSLHPDGRSFATSVAVARYDIWLLEGFKTPTRGLLERLWRR